MQNIKVTMFEHCVLPLLQLVTFTTVLSWVVRVCLERRSSERSGQSPHIAYFHSWSGHRATRHVHLCASNQGYDVWSGDEVF